MRKQRYSCLRRLRQTLHLEPPEKNMQWVFRNLFADRSALTLDAPRAAEGELLVYPHHPELVEEHGLAMLVVREGLDSLIQGSGEVEYLIVNAGFTSPTLDELLAAAFAVRLLGGRALPPGCRAFAQYAALVRQGYRPGSCPLASSLQGI